MTILDSTTVVVYTSAELSDAVSQNNGYDYIYLGADITMTAGIRVNTAKTDLTIDGLYPPESSEIRTLTDTGPTDGQIYVSGSAALTFTFQNLRIYGRSFYGMPYVHAYVGSENVVVVYQSVVYTGPQMIYHTRGLSRLIDCDVMLEAHGWSPQEEVGEVNRIELGGVTTIVKPNETYSTFWVRGTAPSHIKILAGADVTVTSAGYFMYEDNPPDFIIEPEGRFTLATRYGFSYNNIHTLRSCVVGENAVFRYTQQENRGLLATMNLDGELRVEEGASFYMQADFANNGPLIRFTGSGGGLYLDRPESFALYNGVSSSAAVFSFPLTIPFEWTGNQVNDWVTPLPFPTAGGFEDIPQYKWNRTDWDLFTLRGTTSNTQTTVTFHDIPPGELPDLPPFSDLAPYQAKVFSVGNLPLLVDPVLIGLTPITGTTAADAKVRAVYLTGGDTPEDDADETGYFSLMPAEPIPFADLVTVFSNTPFLLTVVTRTAEEDEDLVIVSSPEYVHFGLPPMPEFSGVVLPRRELDAEVIISDTRAVKTPWVLWLKTLGPLQTAGGEILEDGMVFGLPNGDLLTLNETPQAVHWSDYFQVPEVGVSWAENRGILVRASASIRSGEQYSTQLQWSIYPEGVIPSEEDAV